MCLFNQHPVDHLIIGLKQTISCVHALLHAWPVRVVTPLKLQLSQRVQGNSEGLSFAAADEDLVETRCRSQRHI